jgi:hypothetical protein
MRILRILHVLLLLPVIFTASLYSQDDDNGEIKMSQEEWHLKRDQYAVSAIELLKRLEKLDSAIDTLKKINDVSENLILTGCDDRLLALVDANKDSYEDFKRKFEQTENKVNNKTGTPADTRTMYYDEITGSKIRCLPEFSDRYQSLKKNLALWEGKQNNDNIKISEGSYLVAKGDCLWKISESKYNNPYLWPVIWDANKISVINASEIVERKLKSVSNPNLIYPGQVLKIPKVSDSQLNDASEKKKKNYLNGSRTQRKLLKPRK